MPEAMRPLPAPAGAAKAVCGIYALSAGPNGSYLPSAPGVCQ